MVGLVLEVRGREEQDPGAVVQHAGDTVAAVYPTHTNTRLYLKQNVISIDPSLGVPCTIHKGVH